MDVLAVFQRWTSAKVIAGKESFFDQKRLSDFFALVSQVGSKKPVDRGKVTRCWLPRKTDAQRKMNLRIGVIVRLRVGGHGQCTDATEVVTAA